MSERIITSVVVMILLVLVFGNIGGAAQHPQGEEPEEKTGTVTLSGYCDNPATNQGGSIKEELVDLPEGTIIEITFVLSWQDDEGSSSDPDTFSLSAIDATNGPVSGQSNSGEVTISRAEDDLNNSFTVEVACLSAGPTPIGILGLRQETDPGNSWAVVITYVYTEPASGGPGGPPANVVALLASPIFWSHVILMIISLYLFLITGFVGGTLFITGERWEKPDTFMKRWFGTPKMVLLLAGIAFIAFFLASVPIGMWVAGKMYGWAKCWTGFPAFWNIEMYDITNADNTSLIGLVLWFIPLYLNRSQIYGSRLYDKVLGRFEFAQRLRERAPAPRLSNRTLGLCFFFIGILIWLVYAVQPHGSSM